MSLTGDYFYDVVVKRDNPEDDPIILDGVEVFVEVLQDGAWNATQIYNNESLSDVKLNPFVTASSGELAFWAPKGEYRITITDLQITPRIDPREIVWMSIPYSDFDKLRWPGEIIMSGRELPPAGWLDCDGSPVSRTQYAKLFNEIGIRYGAGDGGTTFNLPPFNQRFPIGPGVNIALGDTDSLAEANRSPTHHHTQPSHAHGMPHTHSGTSDQEAAVTSSSNGSHNHGFVTGGQLASRQASTTFQSTPTGDDSMLQTLYIPGFNSGLGSNPAPMDAAAAHAHTVAAHDHAVSVGSPSTPNTSGAGAENTGDITSPHCAVNFFIKF